MAKREPLDLKLPSISELFSTQDMRDTDSLPKVVEIPLRELHDFENHPFHINNDEKMAELVASIEAYGVVTPGLVRPRKEGGYEIISGHSRKFASALAGKESMPVIVKDLTDDESVIFMVDSNLQREEILPSEKAFAYKMRLEAMSRQGKRTDLTSSPLGTKLRADEELAQKAGDSRNQVHRYIRLTELIPSILKMVDEKTIAFRPAVELSYLQKEEQEWLFDSMNENVCTPSLAQSQKIKKLSQAKRLNEDVIYSILSEEKPNQKEKLTLSEDKIGKFFPPDFSIEKREKIVLELLERWDRNRKQHECSRIVR